MWIKKLYSLYVIFERWSFDLYNVDSCSLTPSRNYYILEFILNS